MAIAQDNNSYYSRPEILANYGNADYLSDAEQVLLAHYLKPGMRVLDLGVGGGRTSPVLSHDALEYVGIDYAPAMVELCRNRFPHLRYEAMDAADLSAFGDGHFDLVVFSFNGLGCLVPDESRLQCIAECKRVLKPGGVFIFSLHYSRSLLLRPQSGASWKGHLALVLRSFHRFFSRITKSCFWRGEGYLLNSAIGNTLVWTATPDVVSRMLQTAGFTVLDTVGDDFPRRNIPCMTRWYYYAARK